MCLVNIKLVHPTDKSVGFVGRRFINHNNSFKEHVEKNIILCIHPNCTIYLRKAIPDKNQKSTSNQLKK